MRPIVTLILFGLIAVAIAYFLLRAEPENPRLEQFIDCYVELAILHEGSDTVTATFVSSRDSLLAQHGFDEPSFLNLKDSLDQQPEYLVEVWKEIDARLKELQKELEITE
jgi:hypothetical protein